MVPTVGIEPTTARLQVECSTVEPCRLFSNSRQKKLLLFPVNKFHFMLIERAFTQNKQKIFIKNMCQSLISYFGIKISITNNVKKKM